MPAGKFGIEDATGILRWPSRQYVHMRVVEWHMQMLQRCMYVNTNACLRDVINLCLFFVFVLLDWHVGHILRMVHIRLRWIFDVGLYLPHTRQSMQSAPVFDMHMRRGTNAGLGRFVFRHWMHRGWRFIARSL